MLRISSSTQVTKQNNQQSKVSQVHIQFTHAIKAERAAIETDNK